MARQSSIVQISGHLAPVISIMVLAHLISLAVAIRPLDGAFRNLIQAENSQEQWTKPIRSTMDMAIKGTELQATDVSCETTEGAAAVCQRELLEILDYGNPSHSINDKHRPSVPDLYGQAAP
ncbi:hypothetical protein O6H91_Y235100 [Diphasiastrum complanatum]|nr:hypothetical protein O6H91_Y245700 [Diphasiastrum complanatum]KAJ7299408.1 hypothetical protein O6H91_Y235100 [Diphasiastrum complanatum]